MGDLSGFSHQELYAAVHAGDEGQVGALAGTFDILQKEAHSLAGELHTDLVRLGDVWRSAAGTTYQETVGTIAGFATALSGDLLATRNKLEALPAAVRQAKRDMPDPADTDDHDKLARNVAIGSVFGPVVGGIAALKGHQQDQQEKAAAKERAVRVAQQLASVHQTNGFEQSPTAPPARLPRFRGAAAGATGVATGAAARSAGTGTAGTAPRSRALGAADTVQGLDRTSGAGVPAGTVPAGGGLSGIGHVGDHGAGFPAAAGTPVGATGGGPGLGGALGLGAAGAAGVGIAGSGTRRSGALPASAGTAGRPLFDAGSSRLATAGSGVLGSGDGSVARTGGSATGAAGPATGSAAGTPGTAGTAADGADHRAPFAATGRGTAVDDEGAEHDTWLTEEEMVWGGDTGAPPPVLGGHG
jgi:uncharacterized protein YukE